MENKEMMLIAGIAIVVVGALIALKRFGPPNLGRLREKTITASGIVPTINGQREEQMVAGVPLSQIFPGVG